MADLTERTTLKIVKVGAAAAGSVGRSGRWTDAEQSAAQLQFVFADSIGQEPELPDAD